MEIGTNYHPKTYDSPNPLIRFADRQATMVTCFEVLEHLDRPSQIEALQNMRMKQSFKIVERRFSPFPLLGAQMNSQVLYRLKPV